MSCKHLIWNCYCKLNQDFCEQKLFPGSCKDYCREDEVEDMKKTFNNGPATSINCACGVNNSTAENDYVSMLEMFINRCYPNENFGFFGMDAISAEGCVDKNMRCLGYNTDMVNRACVDTMNNFKSKNNAPLYKLKCFVNSMLSKPHKDYPERYPFEYRFVLTLILGYLNKLDSVAIINCDNPETYFEDKVSDVCVADLTRAINKVRLYAKESNAFVLAEGMRKFDAWLEQLRNKNIPPKELTLADIEKQLGYKIKIVGEEK